MAHDHVDLEQWERLLNESQSFKERAPWKWMANSPVVGVKDPVTGEMFYCSVMGAGGEEFGLLAFRGDTGYWGFSRIQEADELSDFENQVTIRHLNMLSFSLGSRDEVDDDVRKLYRQLGFSFRGKQAWPVFSSFIPGYSSWRMDKDEMDLLIRCLQQTMAFATYLQGDEVLRSEWELGDAVNEDVHDGVYRVLCLVPATEASPDRLISTPNGSCVLEWQNVRPNSPVRIDSSYGNPAFLKRRAELTKRNVVWEFDVVPTPIPAGERNERPATAEVSLCVDSNAGLILGFDMTFGAEPSRPAANLLQIIDDAGFRPSIVCVCRTDVVAALKPITDALGIDLRHAAELPNLEDAYFSMLDSMMG